jgi:hypothetical protein
MKISQNKKRLLSSQHLLLCHKKDLSSFQHYLLHTERNKFYKDSLTLHVMLYNYLNHARNFGPLI